MRRRARSTTAALLAASTLLAAPAGLRASPEYLEVLISSSSTNPRANEGSAWTGEQVLYVWSMGLDSTNQIEFQFTGPLQVVDLTPLNGVVNMGTVTAPILLFPQCVEGYFGGNLAAEIRVTDPTGSGGTLCLTEHPDTKRNCSYSCLFMGFKRHEYACFSTGLPVWGASTSADCGPVATEQLTWGRVKSTYR